MGREIPVLSSRNRENPPASPVQMDTWSARHRFLGMALALLLPGAPPGRAAEPGARVFAAVAQLDRMSERPLWPGFDPRAIPLEVFEGGRTWILRHPRPPAEFLEVPGHPEARVFDGRHSSLRANTSLEIAGVTTAAASFEGRREDSRILAALLLHEAFHVFQAARHPKWGGNEAELFVYPVEDPDLLALRRLEWTALRRAISSDNPEGAAGWGARAVVVRRERFSKLPAFAAAYERGTEVKEGLARYVEVKAAGLAAPLLPPSELPTDRVRDRAYSSGCAIAFLLDRLEPDWKEALETSDAALDELLGRAVERARPLDFKGGERSAARRRAHADVVAWLSSRASLRRSFESESGWRVIVESDAPLFPQGFDPLHVERLSGSEILHTRWIKLGNAAGSFESLDHRCLTESAGKHPLFEGVRRATVAGLPEEPRVQDVAGAVKISGAGLALSFENARARTAGSTITVTVGRSE